jgi:hypothetical protein
MWDYVMYSDAGRACCCLGRFSWARAAPAPQHEPDSQRQAAILQGGEGAERLLKAATDAAPASLQPMLASVAARIKTKPADVDTDDDEASESVAAEGWVMQSCRLTRHIPLTCCHRRFQATVCAAYYNMKQHLLCCHEYWWARLATRRNSLPGHMTAVWLVWSQRSLQAMCQHSDKIGGTAPTTCIHRCHTPNTSRCRAAARSSESDWSTDEEGGGGGGGGWGCGISVSSPPPPPPPAPPSVRTLLCTLC